MRLLLGAVTAAVCLGLPGAALAQLRTCVEVEGAPGDPDALTRLIRSELDRHATHHAVIDDCQAHLTVEVVDLGAREGKWLTGRINTQVPHRERIESDGLVATVQRLLTVVLANDPLVLRGPESNAWLKRQGRALERSSVMHFGAEVYQMGIMVGSALETLPGLAVALRREVSALHVGVRLGGALELGTQPDRLRLRGQVDGQIEATIYAAPTANTSLFAGALAGLVYQRFAGPATLDGPGDTATVATWGLSMGLRGGIETMRTADLRLLAFLELQAPAFVSRDPDHGVVDQWTPAATVGAGVLF